MRFLPRAPCRCSSRLPPPSREPRGGGLRVSAVGQHLTCLPVCITVGESACLSVKHTDAHRLPPSALPPRCLPATHKVYARASPPPSFTTPLLPGLRALTYGHALSLSHTHTKVQVITQVLLRVCFCVRHLRETSLFPPIRIKIE